MKKPAHIPTETLETVRAAYSAIIPTYEDYVATVAATVSAERERCAKIADLYATNERATIEERFTAKEIAAAIRGIDV